MAHKSPSTTTIPSSPLSMAATTNHDSSLPDIMTNISLDFGNLMMNTRIDSIDECNEDADDIIEKSLVNSDSRTLTSKIQDIRDSQDETTKLYFDMDPIIEKILDHEREIVRLQNLLDRMTEKFLSVQQGNMQLVYMYNNQINKMNNNISKTASKIHRINNARYLCDVFQQYANLLSGIANQQTILDAVQSGNTDVDNTENDQCLLYDKKKIETELRKIVTSQHSVPKKQQQIRKTQVSSDPTVWTKNNTNNHGVQSVATLSVPTPTSTDLPIMAFNGRENHSHNNNNTSNTQNTNTNSINNNFMNSPPGILNDSSRLSNLRESSQIEQVTTINNKNRSSLAESLHFQQSNYSSPTIQMNTVLSSSQQNQLGRTHFNPVGLDSEGFFDISNEPAIELSDLSISPQIFNNDEIGIRLTPIEEEFTNTSLCNIFPTSGFMPLKLKHSVKVISELNYANLAEKFAWLDPLNHNINVSGLLNKYKTSILMEKLVTPHSSLFLEHYYIPITISNPVPLVISNNVMMDQNTSSTQTTGDFELNESFPMQYHNNNNDFSSVENTQLPHQQEHVNAEFIRFNQNYLFNQDSNINYMIGQFNIPSLDGPITANPLTTSNPLVNQFHDQLFSYFTGLIHLLITCNQILQYLDKSPYQEPFLRYVHSNIVWDGTPGETNIDVTGSWVNILFLNQMNPTPSTFQKIKFLKIMFKPDVINRYFDLFNHIIKNQRPFDPNNESVNPSLLEDSIIFDICISSLNTKIAIQNYVREFGHIQKFITLFSGIEILENFHWFVINGWTNGNQNYINYQNNYLKYLHYNNNNPWILFLRSLRSFDTNVISCKVIYTRTTKLKKTQNNNKPALRKSLKNNNSPGLTAPLTPNRIVDGSHSVSMGSHVIEPVLVKKRGRPRKNPNVNNSKNDPLTTHNDMLMNNSIDGVLSHPNITHGNMSSSSNYKESLESTIKMIKKSLDEILKQLCSTKGLQHSYLQMRIPRTNIKNAPVPLTVPPYAFLTEAARNQVRIQYSSEIKSKSLTYSTDLSNLDIPDTFFGIHGCSDRLVSKLEERGKIDIEDINGAICTDCNRPIRLKTTKPGRINMKKLNNTPCFGYIPCHCRKLVRCIRCYVSRWFWNLSFLMKSNNPGIDSQPIIFDQAMDFESPCPECNIPWKISMLCLVSFDHLCDISNFDEPSFFRSGFEISQPQQADQSTSRRIDPLPSSSSSSSAEMTNDKLTRRLKNSENGKKHTSSNDDSNESINTTRQIPSNQVLMTVANPRRQRFVLSDTVQKTSINKNSNGRTILKNGGNFYSHQNPTNQSQSLSPTTNPTTIYPYDSPSSTSPSSTKDNQGGGGDDEEEGSHLEQINDNHQLLDIFNTGMSFNNDGDNFFPDFNQRTNFEFDDQ